MLVVTRHMLNRHLLDLSDLVSRYARNDTAFVEETLSWLATVEQTLLQLRHPLVGLVATTRSQVLATRDGYRDRELSAAQTNHRQARRATAAIAVGRVEVELRRIVDDTDKQLDTFREKIAQLLAVASQQTPIPVQSGLPREEWLRRVWSDTAITSEASGMHAYLNAAVPHSDLLALLGDVLDNLLAPSEPETPVAVTG